MCRSKDFKFIREFLLYLCRFITNCEFHCSHKTQMEVSVGDAFFSDGGLDVIKSYFLSEVIFCHTRF